MLTVRNFFLIFLLSIIVDIHSNAQTPDNWISKAGFGGSSRYGSVGFSIGNKGYFGTGFDDSYYYNDFWEFDPVTNTWTQKADFGGLARYLATGFSIGQKGYIGTGINGNNKYKDFWEYDPAGNIWIPRADFGGTARSAATGFSIGVKGYIGTGNDGVYCRDFWEFDQALNSWIRKANMGGVGRQGAVGFSIGVKGYIGTGYGSNFLNDFWEYNPSSDSWVQKASFSGDPRYGAIGFSLGLKGYIGTGICFIGQNVNVENAYRKDFWEYDPTTDSWTQRDDYDGNVIGNASAFAIGPYGYVGLGKSQSGNNGPSGAGIYSVYKNELWEYTPLNSNYVIVDSITPNGNICSGSNINVYYHCNQTFYSGNYFYFQISDANGEFGNPLLIGSILSNTSGVINCQIPVNTLWGYGYKLRILSSAPAMISNPSSSFTVNCYSVQAPVTAIIKDSLSDPSNFLNNSIIRLNVHLTNNANCGGSLTYAWSNDGGISFWNGSSFTSFPLFSISYNEITIPNPNAQTTYTCYVKCSADSFVRTAVAIYNRNNCSTQQLIAKVNGSSLPSQVNLGDLVTLTADITSLNTCDSIMLYAWRSGAGGNDYWNGSDFTGDSTNYSSNYDSINAQIILPGTYTVYAKCISQRPIIATGGVISYSGEYKIHTFSTSGVFSILSGSGQLHTLLVGGGGGGGGWGYINSNNTGAGGGGGGQVVENNNSPVLSPGIFNIAIGNGGSGGNTAGNNPGSSGGVTTLSGLGLSFVANGGGGGGGGAGNANGANYYAHGGTGDLVNAGGGTTTGNGGNGPTSTITGQQTYYGGGGGGGAASTNNHGAGGLGGGGNGRGYDTGQATDGVNGLGGGGGGAFSNGWPGANGGSGLVIIRYKEACINSSSVTITAGQCVPPTVTLSVNGSTLNPTVVAGSTTVLLSATTVGGSNCIGNSFSFAWSNDGGNTFWNGTTFSGSAVYNVSYSTINAPISSSNTTFTCYVKCNSSPLCIASGSVTVQVTACASPSVSVKANGFTNISNVNLGDSVLFTATISGGTTCGNGWSFAWRSGQGGNDYWNGTNFTGDSTNYSVNYDTIFAKVLFPGNYTAYVKCSTAGSVLATGGSISTVGPYKVHTFTNSGNFQILSGIGNVEYLVVGGGGGGGRDAVGNKGGGGGGGGQVIYNSSGINLGPGSYNVTVGNGGHETTGGSSEFNGIIAQGGTTGHYNGQGGSCPGGGTGGVRLGGNEGGGGGGANGNGTNGLSAGGYGGTGIANSITGTVQYYGGGGGGAPSGGGGIGGGGIGGGGGNGFGNSGSPNTGGGCGGSFNGSIYGTGSGGSGVVIVRYLETCLSSGSVSIVSPSCIAPSLTAKANGSAVNVSATSGSRVILSANPVGGQNCSGLTWEYAWSNDGGVNYWNGNSFSPTPNYSVGFSGITIPEIYSSATYTCFVRCSGLPACNSSSSVTVNLVSCTAPTLTTHINGSGSSAVVSLGDSVTLSVTTSGGSPCYGNGVWQYAWRSGQGGNDYWNGTSFSGDSTNFSTSYQSITTPIFNGGAYTIYAQCSNNPGGFITATGGTISTLTTDAIYRIHTFLNNGVFQITSGSGRIETLLVGGGGGGGGWGYINSNNTGAGGGGGGQVLQSISNNDLFPGVYNVAIGAGGPGGNTAGNNPGTAGGNTILSGPGLSIVVNGGGGGGGGAGNANGANYYAHGGNGDLVNAGGGTTTGNGGNGPTSTITGQLTYYGGGGGGAAASTNNHGAGGLGGGGNGRGYDTGQATDGINGLGGGGGGAFSNGWPGANGGSGLAIIRYKNQGCNSSATATISINTCTPPVITVQANGLTGSLISCTGNNISLNVIQTSGSSCSGNNWVYGWSNDGGVSFWNGNSFVNGQFYDSTYKSISFPASASNISYTCYAKCFNNPSCISNSSVIVYSGSPNDIWLSKFNIPGAGRSGAFGFSIGLKGYVGGGFDGSTYHKDFWEYDPITNVWTQRADFAGTGRYGAGAFVLNNLGYVGCGDDGSPYWTNDFWQYNPVNNTWFVKASVPGPGSGGRLGPVGFAIGNKGYFATGGTAANNNYSNDLYEYNPITDSWTSKAPYPGPGVYSAIGFSIGNKGYVGTGANGSNIQNNFYEYNPDSDSWTQKASVGGSPRVYASAFSISGMGYVGGGASTGGNVPSLNDFWEYNPSTNQWTQRANLAGSGKRYSIAFAIGSRGYFGSGMDNSNYFSDFYEYIPLKSIATASVQPTINCAGNTLIVSFNKTGDFTCDSSYTVQISDSSGSFAAPTIIGTVIGSGANTVTCTLPVNLPSGKHYRVRVVNSLANTQYQDNGTDIIIGSPNDTWIKKDNFPAGGRAFAVAFSIGDKGYLGTGSDSAGNRKKDFWEYEPGTDTWTQRADVGGLPRTGAVGFSIGAKGYIGTGETGTNIFANDFWEYDPGSNTWLQKLSFPGAPRSMAIGFATAGKGFVGTGVDNSNLKNDFWQFDPLTNTWIQKSNFGGTPRFEAVCFVIKETQRAYVGTGYDSNGPRNDFWEYNPYTDSWNPRASFGGPGRRYAFAFSLGSKGFVGTGADNSASFSDFWQYEPGSDSWTQKTSFGAGVWANASAFTINGVAYVATGRKNGEYRNDLWMYAPDHEISVGRIYPDNYCPGSSIQIPFSTTGVFGSCTGQNTFQAQLSNSSGYFISPIVIGSLTATTDSTIVCQLPSNLPAGTNYKLRIVSTTPAYAGDSGITSISVEDLKSNVWAQKAYFPGSARSAAFGFSIGSKGYFGTGHNPSNGDNNDFWEYDPASDTWTQKANYGGVPRHNAKGFSIDTLGYAGTGAQGSSLLSDFWQYSPTTNTWVQRANYGGGPISDAVAFSIGNLGYLGTGYDGLGGGYRKDFWQYNPQSNSWQKKADFGGTPRYAAAAFSIGNKGYLGTGFDGSNKNDLWEYNPGTDSWVSKTAFAGSPRYHSGGFSIGAYGYIGAGFDNSSTVYNDFWQYNQETDSWIPVLSLPGAARQSVVCFGINGRGYITSGGNNNYSQRYSDLWEYTPVNSIAAGTIQPTTYCPGDSVHIPYSFSGGPLCNKTFTAILSFDNGSFGTNGSAVLGQTSASSNGVIHGIIPTSVQAGLNYRVKVVSYNPPIDGSVNGDNIIIGTKLTNNWVRQTDLPTQGRWGAFAFSIDSLGYIGAGNDGAGNKRDLWSFNPNTNTWTQQADFGGTARHSAAAFVISGLAYVGGGNDGSNLNDLWFYNPVSNTWNPRNGFPGAGKSGHVGIAINGKGYFITGSNTQDVLQYDPIANSWSYKLAFPGPGRSYASGFSIGNKGYIGTGINGSTVLNDFYEYNPISETWQVKANFPGAARLNAIGFASSNRGFIGGGADAPGNVNGLSDFYEFDPVVNQWNAKTSIGGGARRYAASFFLNGKGYVGTGLSGSNSKADLWVYQPDPAINISSINPSSACPGSSINVGFNSTGTFGICGSNTYTVQLSSSSGSFVSPTNIGSLVTSSNSGVVSCTIPSYASNGNQYRIRVVSNNPNVIGSDNGTDIPVGQNLNVWTSRNSFPVATRQGAFAFSIGSKGYVGTGYDGSIKNDFWEYDAVNNIWTQKMNFPGSARSGAIGFSISGKGYAGLGGYGSYNNDLYEYNPVSNTWSLPLAPFPGGVRGAAVAFTIAGKAYVGTGENASSTVFYNDLYEYNPMSNTWISRASFSSHGRKDASAFVIDGFGYVGLGAANSNNWRDVWKYNPISDQWQQMNDFPGTGRAQCASFNTSTRGYIVGGYDGNILNQLWEYSPNTDSWINKPDFPGTSRYAASAFSIADKGYFGFGKDGGGWPSDFYLYTPDYSINTGVIYPLYYCANANLSVPFTASGLLGNCNSITYTAQLSNASGSFSAPINIGSVVSSTSGVINCQIPSGVLNGNGYRVRVVASVPSVIGTPNTSNITIYTSPAQRAISNSPVCPGDTLSLTAGGGINYSWSGPNGFSSSQSNPVLPAVNVASAGSYSVSITDSAGCIAHLNVNVTIPQATASSNSPICSGSLLLLSSSPGLEHSWTGPNGFSSIQQNPGQAMDYLGSGLYTVNVKYSNQCILTASTNVIVNPLPVASSNSPVDSGLTLNLFSSVAGNCTWSGPNGFSSILQNPSIANITPAQAGVYSLQVTDSSGCTASVNTIVSVNTPGNPGAPGSAGGPMTYQAVSGDIFGNTPGNFNINDQGAALYDIPLILSPGISSMQPELSLMYNSQSGNSILGMAWSLRGLSMVSRSQQTQIHDGLVKGINFNADDRFALDGERMVEVVPGTYGKNQCEYRLENNNFDKIVSYGLTAGNPDSIIVYTKSGLIRKYATTSNSRILKYGSNSVVFWLISQIADRNGNTIEFIYDVNAADGEFYPKEIKYTGNSATGMLPRGKVSFTYAPRTDIILRYVSGAKIQTTKRLTSIKSLFNDTLVREYQIQYNDSSSDGWDRFSRISSVQEFGSDGLSLNPIQFTYNYRSLADKVYYRDSGKTFDTTNVVMQADLSGSGKSYLWEWSWNNGFIDTLRSNISNNDLKQGVLSFTDINADGLSDMFWYNPVNGNNRWYLNIRDSLKLDSLNPNDIYYAYNCRYHFVKSDDIIPTNEISGTGNDTRMVQFTDFNGDGLPDLFIYQRSSGTNKIYYNTTFSNTLSFNISNPQQNPLTPSDVTGGTAMFPLDFNGDNLTDFVWYDTSLVSSNAFKVFQTSQVISQGNVNIQVSRRYVNCQVKSAVQVSFMDFNGDGLTDIYTQQGSGVFSGAIKRYVNKGDFTLDGPYQYQPPGNLFGSGSNFKMLSTDINADGYTDFLWYDTLGNIFTSINAAQPQALFNTVASDAINLYQTFNGNGIPKAFQQIKYSNSYSPDFLVKYKTGTTWFRIRNNLSRAGLLVAINDQNKTVSINYKELYHDKEYTPSKNVKYPQINFAGHFLVVSDYTVSRGSVSNSMSYFYSGGRMDLNGHGFRGFGKIAVYDKSNNILKERFFNLDTASYKFSGNNEYANVSRLCVPSGNSYIPVSILDTTYISYALNTYCNNKSYYSYVSQSVSKRYDLNNLLIDTTISRQYQDLYGNVTSMVVQHGTGFKDSVVNSYLPADETKWILGRLQRATSYRYVPGQNVFSRSSSFIYESNGLLSQEIMNPDSSNQVKVIKSYTYNAYGNISQSTVNAWNGTALENRITTTTYDPTQRFVITTVNQLGHTVTSTYDNKLGKQLSETNENGLTTRYQYDGVGRLIKTTYPDGNWETLDYRKDTQGNGYTENTVYKVVKQSSLSRPVEEFYDYVDRKAGTKSLGFNGQTILTYIHFDNKGRVLEESEPFFPVGAVNEITYTYDDLGRQISRTLPGNRVETTVYSGLTTEYTNAKSQKKTVTKNVLDQIIWVKDDNNKIITYQYDGAGNLVRITDPSGNITLFTYDIRGYQVKLNDPDNGEYNYTYNSFGELKTLINPRGQVTNYTYDILGRLVQRTEPEGLTTWSFDSSPNGIGKLAGISSFNGYTYSIGYDSLSRLVSEVRTINGANYTSGSTYDKLGRLETTIYPGGFATRNLYNVNGFFSEVRNAASNALYWQANTINSLGQLTSQTFGNNITENTTYDALTHFLEQKTAKTIANDFRQDLQYSYDDLGNVLSRIDHLNNRHEDFGYDNLNRLTLSHVLGYDSVSVAYDFLGNIVSKSDVGTYTYGGVNAGPHKVMSVQLNNSVCLPSESVQSSYTSFNKVYQIIRDSMKMRLEYGPDYQRNVQKLYKNDTLVKTKVYVGGLYESETENGITREMYYIRGLNGVVAVYNQFSNGQSNVQYWHKDNLGSLVMVSDSAGNIVQQFNYDAWGKRRDPITWAALGDSVSFAYDRSYTGHEYYDLFDIIDMNGRVYDPMLARFLSPDAVIQDVTNLQSLNRYSYVLNNPMVYTDPSGYLSFKKIAQTMIRWTLAVTTLGASEYFDPVKHAIRVAEKWTNENWKTLVTVAVVVGVTYLTGGMGSSAALTLLQATLSGAASGFAGAVTGVMLNGGNGSDALRAGLKGAAIGAVTGFATCGVGDIAQAAGGGNVTVGSMAIKVAGHGTVQGGASVANGGKFSHGFYAGAISAGAEPGVTSIGNKAGETFASAAVGGTASAVSGGKFSNGAISGAYVYLLNHCLHTNRIDEGGEGQQQANLCDVLDHADMLAPMMPGKHQILGIASLGCAVGSDIRAYYNGSLSRTELLQNTFCNTISFGVGSAAPVGGYFVDKGVNSYCKDAFNSFPTPAQPNNQNSIDVYKEYGNKIPLN